MRSAIVTLALAAACLLPAAARAADPAPTPAPASQWITIHNDFYWTDTDGNRILTRSGCLRQFNGTWYWYGGNPRGFREQYVYTSPDLVHWTNKGVIFRETDYDSNRIDVLYNQPTKKYFMFLKYHGNGAHFAVATSDTPDGQFTLVSQTLVDNALMGDMSIFEDDDGKAYLCYVSWAVGTNAQHGIYALSDDYLKLDHRVYLWDIRSREAPHIFKRNGLYYYGTSRTAGIQSSGTAYYTAKNLEGPWSPAKPLDTPGMDGGPDSKNSWDSQVDFVYPFPNPKDPAATFYMFAGDRWVKNPQEGRNGDYVWLPMEFDGDTPIVHYYQDWDLNVAAGTWRKFDPARNLAAGKPATASSTDGDHPASNVTAPKTYVNYVNTFWQSEPPEAQSITIDLQNPTPNDRVILKWGNSAAKDFKIQSSPDNSTWTDLFTTTRGGSNTVTDETFPLTTARYIRMTATARAPIPFAGFGGGRGRGRGNRGGRNGAGSQPTSAPTFTPPPPPTPTGYTLFDFEVLKD